MWHLREVAADPEQLTERPWSGTTLYVLNRRVYFNEPGTGKTREVSGLQYALLPLKIASRGRLTKRLQGSALVHLIPLDDFERHRNVARNALVVAGTRIPVRIIREFVDAGYSVDEIIKEYPLLTPADVEAARASAA